MSIYNDNIDNIKQQVNDFYSIIKQRSEEDRLAAEEALKKAEEDKIAAEKEMKEKAEREFKAYLERKKAEEAIVIAEMKKKAAEEAERKAEEERLAAEEAERKAEEERIVAERKAEEERLATERKAEEERIASEEAARIAVEEAAKIKESNDRIAAEKKAESERLVAEARAEAKRFAAESMAAEAKLAADFAAYKAKEEKKKAEEAARIAEQEKIAAEEAARIAEQEKIAAEKAARIAEQEKIAAEKEKIAAEEASRIAIESLKQSSEKMDNINKIISVAVSTIHNKPDNIDEKDYTNDKSISLSDDKLDNRELTDKLLPAALSSVIPSSETINKIVDDKIPPTVETSDEIVDKEVVDDNTITPTVEISDEIVNKEVVDDDSIPPTVETSDEIVDKEIADDDTIIPTVETSDEIVDKEIADDDDTIIPTVETSDEELTNAVIPTIDEPKETNIEITEKVDSSNAMDKIVQEPLVETALLSKDTDMQNKVNMLKMVISELLLELYVRNFSSKEFGIDYQSPEIELQPESILDKNHAKCMEILEKIKSKYPKDDVNYIMNDGKTCFIEVNKKPTNVEIVGGSGHYISKLIEEIDMDVDIDTINTDGEIKEQSTNKDTILSNEQTSDIKDKQDKSELNKIKALAVATINNNLVDEYSEKVSSITPQKLASIASIVVNKYLLSEKDKNALNEIDNDNIENTNASSKDDIIKQIAVSVVSNKH